MPPKPKYTVDEIINAAYEMTRENGIDSVAARSVGTKLGTSSSPIFTVFDSMDDLKEAVFNKAKQAYLNYMSDIFEGRPALREFGRRWVGFAIQEPHLYQLLFLQRKRNLDPRNYYSSEFDRLLEKLVAEISDIFEMNSDSAKRLLNQMIIHANGLSSFCIETNADFSLEQVDSYLSQTCIGLVLEMKLAEGNFNLDYARKLIEKIQKNSYKGNSYENQTGNKNAIVT